MLAPATILAIRPVLWCASETASNELSVPYSGRSVYCFDLRTCPWMRTTLALLCLLFGPLGGCLAMAQSNSPVPVVNEWFGGAPGAAHGYKIAKLPASGAGTFDHLHLVATIDTLEFSQYNSYIDATFANRNGFTYSYTLRGATVNPLAGSLQAYQNADGSVDIYIALGPTYVVAGYTILEAVGNTPYSQPSDNSGDFSHAGSLIFDVANPSQYPPQTYVNYGSGDGSGSPMRFGIGTAAPQNGLSVATGINVDQNNSDAGTGFQSGYGPAWGLSFGSGSGEAIGSARVAGSPNLYGLDFYAGFQKRMAISQWGNVGIGTTSPRYTLDVNGDIFTSGTLRFSDGSSLTSANNIKLQSLQVGGNGTGAIIAGINLDPGNNTSFVGNLPNSGMLLEGWNYSRGGGEQDFIGNRGGGGTGGFRFYDEDNGGKLTPLLTMLGNGKVGIGTYNPAPESDINGPALDVNGVIKISGSGAYLKFSDQSEQTTAYTGNCPGGGDYAESVDVSGEAAAFAPGDVMVVDPDSVGHFLKSSTRYSTLVAGIYSTKPGFVGRRQLTPKTSTEIPMAMIGIVPTKVSAENGPIKVGDLLVTSSVAGYAMHGTEASLMTGAVVGKALGKLEAGSGVIEVLVSLQ